MRIALTTACLVLLFLTINTQSAYGQTTCACENSPKDKVCPKAEISCPDGCMAICSPNNACYVSCRTDMLDDRRWTKTFVQKSGQQIAAELSKLTGDNIQFALYPGKPNKLYNLKLKNSDIWHALTFLDKRGTVRVNQVEFRTFRNIQIEMKSGRRMSVRFTGLPAGEVVSQLALMSQTTLHIKSGDPASPVFVEVKEKTLADIIKQIASAASVEIAVGNQKYQKK